MATQTRKKRLKRFATWTEVIDFLAELSEQVDSIAQRAPNRFCPRTVRRSLTRVNSAIIHSMTVVTEQREKEWLQNRALACGRLRARGLPELAAYVKEEIRKMPKSPGV